MGTFATAYCLICCWGSARIKCKRPWAFCQVTFLTFRLAGPPRRLPVVCGPVKVSLSTPYSVQARRALDKQYKYKEFLSGLVLDLSV